MLLHGYLESSDVWNVFEQRLADEFRVICIDLPGHGRSGIYDEIHTMEFLAGVVRELLAGLGINKFFIAGHSLGGYVVLAILEYFPENLTGYCLFHSHPFNDSEEAIIKRNREINLVQRGMKARMYPENVIKMFADINLERSGEAVSRSKAIAAAQPGDGIIALLRGMIARPSRVTYMENGEVPCLWILGALDNYIPYELMCTKVRLPSNAELHVLHGSGHMGFIEEQEESLKVVSLFIRKHNS